MRKPTADSHSLSRFTSSRAPRHPAQACPGARWNRPPHPSLAARCAPAHPAIAPSAHRPPGGSRLHPPTCPSGPPPVRQNQSPLPDEAKKLALATTSSRAVARKASAAATGPSTTSPHRETGPKGFERLACRDNGLANEASSRQVTDKQLAGIGVPSAGRLHDGTGRAGAWNHCLGQLRKPLHEGGGSADRNGLAAEPGMDPPVQPTTPLTPPMPRRPASRAQAVRTSEATTHEK